MSEIPNSGNVVPEASVSPLDERAALRFRHSRATAGPLGETIANLSPEQRDTVRLLLNRAPDLRRDTVRGGELHRSLAPHMAAVMTDPETRPMVMDALDATTRLESDRLKEEASSLGGFNADLLIVGGGVHAAVLAATYRASYPGARIVAVEASDRIGGQFRSYGTRPVFRINSRGFRREASRDFLQGPGLPGGTNNLNSFGARAPLQLPDITSETYPSNVDMGDTAAINLYLSAETMLNASLPFVDQKLPGQERYTAFLENREAGAPRLRINPKDIVFATGAGGREAFKDTGSPQVWSAEELFAHFGNPNIPFPMEKFIDKRVAIVGGGDTGRVIAELFARLAPQEAYGKSVVQLGGPQLIDWFGTEFANREEFCEQNRSRYEPLAPFISSGEAFFNDAALFRPDRRKVVSLTPRDQDAVKLVDDTGLSTTYDFVIAATPIRPSRPGSFDDGGEENGSIIERAISQFGGQFAAVARRGPHGTYMIGPSAQLPLTRYERSTFAEGIKENTLALWANVIRTEIVARELAEKARAERFPSLGKATTFLLGSGKLGIEEDFADLLFEPATYFEERRPEPDAAFLRKLGRAILGNSQKPF